MSFAQTLSAEDMQAICGRLRIFDRKISRLTEPDIDKAMEDFDRSCCRLRGATIQLRRELERRAEQERDPTAPHLKRRLPAVTKSLSTPEESMALLEEANTARKAGRLEEWLNRYPTFEAWDQSHRLLL